mgnify:FL=1
MQNNKTTNEFRTLAKIRERKEELLEEIQKDSEKVSEIWHDTFVKRDEVSKGDFIASLIGNGFMAFDAFLLARKLFKGYGYLFGKGKRKKRI